MTRVDSTTGDWYATSGHMLWIGDRTRQPDVPMSNICAASRTRSASNAGRRSAGRSAAPDRHLNPEDEAGRITLICRFGADKVVDHLPRLMRAVKREGRTVVWSCDPMHGNTIKAANGYKTRPFERV